MALKTRYRLLIEYCGAHFAGFQKLSQKRTVQAELERAYTRLCGHPVQVWGAGRTDTGVHATGQVVAFDSENPRTPEQVVTAGNIMLPPDIRVKSAEIAGPDFHPRFSARSRTYRYLIARSEPDAILQSLAWCVPGPLDLSQMRLAAETLTGKHDFSNFTSRPESDRRHRTILRLELSQAQGSLAPMRGDFVQVEVQADAFMRRMVRLMVSGLVRVGTGALTPAELKGVLEGGDPNLLGAPAPASGLYLISVEY